MDRLRMEHGRVTRRDSPRLSTRILGFVFPRLLNEFLHKLFALPLNDVTRQNKFTRGELGRNVVGVAPAAGRQRRRYAATRRRAVPDRHSARDRATFGETGDHAHGGAKQASYARTGVLVGVERPKLVIVASIEGVAPRTDRAGA